MFERRSVMLFHARLVPQGRLLPGYEYAVLVFLHSEVDKNCDDRRLVPHVH